MPIDMKETIAEAARRLVTEKNVKKLTVKDIVEDSLDYYLTRQGEDGAWHLTWSFGEDERFRKMERWYETHYTMQMLARFKRFNRIDI